MKLGRDVKELKFNHRLWTLMFDAQKCKRCSVNRTLIHIPGSLLTLLDIILKHFNFTGLFYYNIVRRHCCAPVVAVILTF